MSAHCPRGVSGGVSTAIVHDGKVFVGGTFSQLYTPSSSEDQFYDLVTAQPRLQCARSTNPQRSLGGTPDGQGGLLVVVQPGDAFADANGPFVPPGDTTIVRVRTDCQWDRGFAAPTIDPGNPNDLTVGLPVRVGATVYASNSIVGPDSFLRAQVAAFDAVSGARLSFQIFRTSPRSGSSAPGHRDRWRACAVATVSPADSCSLRSRPRPLR